jgi:aspartokinase
MKCVVLKIGGSVLTSDAEAVLAVELVEAHRGTGVCVVAVISAVKGETDRLLGAVQGETDEVKATVLMEGERRARDLVAEELGGLGVRSLEPEAMGLLAAGDVLDACPVGLDESLMADVMEDGGVVLVPGFFGVDAEGQPLLFGRGGSDLTAIFLAGRLGAEECVLYKNVPGIADCDPHGEGAMASFRSWMTLEQAVEEARGVVQEKALAWALMERIGFRVTDCPDHEGTFIRD